MQNLQTHLNTDRINFLSNQEIIYDYRAEIQGTGRRSVIYQKLFRRIILQSLIIEEASKEAPRLRSYFSTSTSTSTSGEKIYEFRLTVSQPLQLYILCMEGLLTSITLFYGLKTAIRKCVGCVLGILIDYSQCRHTIVTIFLPEMLYKSTMHCSVRPRPPGIRP